MVGYISVHSCTIHLSVILSIYRFYYFKANKFHPFFANLTIPNIIIPADPSSTPAERTANGRAKLPDPMLALAKLKKVAITLTRQQLQRGSIILTWSHLVVLEDLEKVQQILVGELHFELKVGLQVCSLLTCFSDQCALVQEIFNIF